MDGPGVYASNLKSIDVSLENISQGLDDTDRVDNSTLDSRTIIFDVNSLDDQCYLNNLVKDYSQFENNDAKFYESDNKSNSSHEIFVLNLNDDQSHIGNAVNSLDNCISSSHMIRLCSFQKR